MAGINFRFARVTEEEVLPMLTFLDCVVLLPSLFLLIQLFPLIWVIFRSTNERCHWIKDNISNPNLKNSMLLKNANLNNSIMLKSVSLLLLLK